MGYKGKTFSHELRLAIFKVSFDKLSEKIGETAIGSGLRFPRVISTSISE